MQSPSCAPLEINSGGGVNSDQIPKFECPERLVR